MTPAPDAVQQILEYCPVSKRETISELTAELFFCLRPEIDLWQFSNLPYHGSSVLPSILNQILHPSHSVIIVLTPNIFPSDTITNRNSNASIPRFPPILSFRHCSKLNPPFFLSHILVPPSFFLYFALSDTCCWHWGIRNNGIACQWLVFYFIIFLPGLFGRCIIVAEEEEDRRLCATDSNEGCLFIFNMECLWAEALFAANPTLEPS